MKPMSELSAVVRRTAHDIHVYHGNGRLEKVHENALVHRLRKAGFAVKQQHPLKVYDEDGTILGEYFADVLVDNCLVVELKAAKTIADEHVAQTLGYLKASRIEHGLLINFGSRRFQIRKFIFNNGKASELGLGKLICYLPFLSVFSAFFVAK
jgi:GxxExxY protein